MRAAPGARVPGGPAPLGPDGPRPRAPARPARAGSRVPVSIGRSSSAATPRSPAPTRTASRCCGRWPRSATRCRIGIPCYPQGHAFIADAPLLEALGDKAPFAHYMTTQLCFDPGAIRRGSPPVAPRACRCRSRSGCPAWPSRIGCWRSARGSASRTRAGSSSRTSGSWPGSSGPAASTGPTAARWARPAARRPGCRHRRPAPVHVQRGRGFESWRRAYLARLATVVAAA